MIEHAIAAANKGFYVFPIIPGDKRPLVKDNLNQATKDPARIREWWSSWPDANVGIATGPSQLVVIDIDVPKDINYNPDFGDVSTLFGLDAWSWLVGNSIGHDKAEPRTYEVETPSGGLHLYFQAPQAMTIKTAASKLAPGIDVRATGGSIVGAGSRTEKGSYEINIEKRPQPLPAWLRAGLRRCGLVETPVEKRTQSVQLESKYVSNGDRYADGAFKKAIEELRSTPIGSGQRNSSLFRTASQLRRFTDSGSLEVGTVADALYAVATNDLAMEHREAESTIRSGLALK